MQVRHPSPEALDHSQTRSCFLPRHKARPPTLSVSIPSSPCLSPSRTTSLTTTVSFLALPLPRTQDKCLLVRPTRTHTTAYCEMPQLTLAPHPASRSVFDTNHSPDHSEYSYSSNQYAYSRPPSPPPRHASPPPARRMPRSNTVSHTRPVSIHHTLPRCQTHPTDLCSAAGPGVFRRPSRSGNEEVLRSRLEGVLSSASSSRDISCPPSPQRKRAATSGESSYGLITPPLGTMPGMTRSRTSPAVSRSSPITPPPSPPFDANRVALQLRDREGYVSFADVEGLGAPNDDQDMCDTERGRARWWSLWKG